MALTPSQPSKPAGRPGRAAVFDHEKLDAYRLELNFISWVTPLLEEAKAQGSAKTREVCDQLDRASLGKALLPRVVSTLCGLVDYFDRTDDRFHEEPVEYTIEAKAKTRTRTRTRTRTKGTF